MDLPYFPIEKLSVRERKFIGSVKFPEKSFKDVCRQIYEWILACELKLGRDLGETPRNPFPFRPGHFTEDGLISIPLRAGAVVEIASARGSGCDEFAIRYFHCMNGPRPIPVMLLENEGFLTTFVFQLNRKSHSVYLWIRLEYCHTSSTGGPIKGSPPRVFQSIKDNCAGVSFLVHAGSRFDEKKREWETSSTWEDVVQVVKDTLNATSLNKLSSETQIMGKLTSRSSVNDSTMPPLSRLALSAAAFLEECSIFSKFDLIINPVESVEEPSENRAPVHEFPVKVVQDEETPKKNVLILELERSLKSTEIVQQFEEKVGDSRRYARLILQHVFLEPHTNEWMDLLIEPLSAGMSLTGDITFSALKTDAYENPLWTYVKRQTKGKIKDLEDDEVLEISFKKPYLLRVQYDASVVEKSSSRKIVTKGKTVWTKKTMNYGIVGVRVAK